MTGVDISGIMLPSFDYQSNKINPHGYTIVSDSGMRIDDIRPEVETLCTCIKNFDMHTGIETLHRPADSCRAIHHNSSKRVIAPAITTASMGYFLTFAQLARFKSGGPSAYPSGRRVYCRMTGSDAKRMASLPFHPATTPARIRDSDRDIYIIFRLKINRYPVQREINNLCLPLRRHGVQS